jgi:hypothetical protein
MILVVDPTGLASALGLLLVVSLIPWLWAVFVELTDPARAERTRTFLCPLDRRRVTATFVGDAPRDVASCSAFAAGSAVACSKACLRLAIARRWPPLDARTGSAASSAR